MALFDAVIYKTLDSSKVSFWYEADGKRHIGEKTQTVHNQLQERERFTLKNDMRVFEKGGVVPHKSSVRLRALLRKTDINLHNPS